MSQEAVVTSFLVLFIVIVMIDIPKKIRCWRNLAPQFNSFFLAKFKGKDVFENGEVYILRAQVIYPQTILFQVALPDKWHGTCVYYSLAEFLEDWEPIKDKAGENNVYLGGEFEFDKIPLFKEKRESTNYDSSETIHLRYLFEEYFQTHKSWKKSLHDRIKDIKDNSWKGIT